ncbi:GumC family protein [Marinoscillum furvescens]|uniref:non-specific protein-tyrosine kinase n=1 Tax=Marinoscillum furvescens DSM 4134 TaxID=1122208 RepID=A0A3D9L1X0_MARFU|nr:polysaccharide biosynthesis tyrosine autokinase [Marinoscillum furvescens]RED96156.1 protein involved in gliding motility EpsB [Marinoscillum furvescens DSM 4134]
MEKRTPAPQQFIQFEEEETIDIKGFLFRLLGIWKWILLSVFVCLAVAFLVNRYQTPKYQVKGSLLIDEDQQDMSAAVMEELDFFASSVNIENEIAILKSYSLTRAVVDSLALFVTIEKLGNVRDSELYGPDVPLLVAFAERPADHQPITLLAKVNEDLTLTLKGGPKALGDQEEITYQPGEPLTTEELTLSIRLNPETNWQEQIGTTFRIKIQNTEEFTKELQENITIASLNKDASIVEIKQEAAQAKKAQDIIATLMNLYIHRELELKMETATKTIAFIDDQLTDIQDALYSAEMQLENFRSDNKILDISQEGVAIYTRLQELEKEAANTDLQLSYYEYLLNYLNTTNPTGSVVSPSTAGISDASLNSLVLQLNELENQLILAESSASEINPQVKQLKAQIQAVLKAMRENVRNLRNTTNILKEDLQLQIEDTERELNRLPASERQLLNIQRRFNLNDDLYVYLQQKRAESGIAKASAVASSKIIDPPLVYEQTQPKKLLNYALGIFFGGFIPIVVLILRDYFVTSVQSAQEIEKKTDLPLLTTIGLSHHDTELVMAEKPRSVVAEGFRTLRASLTFLTEKPIQTIMLTSFGSGDGKTFNSINTAIMMAKTGKKTILLGLDMRKPKIFDSFGVSNDVGASNVLVGNKNLKEVIHHTSVENLDFISSGPVPPNPNELILREAFADMMATLKDRYDCIIIDSPPVGLVSEGFELAKHADCVLFVVRHQKTPKIALNHVEKLREKQLLHNMGIVYNGIDFKKGSRRYGYGYGSYGYGSYGYGGYGSGYYQE